VLLLCIWAGSTALVSAEPQDDKAPAPLRGIQLPQIAPPAIKLPALVPPGELTLGGQVFWADQLVFQDWRLQRHAFSDNYRLLDGNNRRRASGTFESCRAALDKLKVELKLPPMKGKAVLVLHGLAGVRLLAAEMASYVHEKGGYLTFCLSYPSQFDDIGSHAKSLASVIEHLDGVDEINLVAHSMGNLVIRHYLADAAADGKTDRRIKRIVMIGAPNNGAELAAKFGSNPLIATLLGESGRQLGKEWPELAPHLATPACEFGIIAGGSGTQNGLLPVLEGDNDGLVNVASTRLVGARDFIIVPELHFNQLHAGDIQRYTLRFLKFGYFIAENDRHPITEEPKKPEATAKK
jgi:pimeloyl-ACP methyl ester carboxylesterase